LVFAVEFVGQVVQKHDGAMGVAGNGTVTGLAGAALDAVEQPIDRGPGPRAGVAVDHTVLAPASAIGLPRVTLKVMKPQPLRVAFFVVGDHGIPRRGGLRRLIFLLLALGQALLLFRLPLLAGALFLAFLE
jgi:hypothetical protein